MTSYTASQPGLERTGSGLIEMTSAPSRKERVLVFAPDDEESRLLKERLSQRGLPVTVCADIDEWCAEFEAGAGVGIIEAAHISMTEWSRLGETLSHQPAWSDFPLIVLTDDHEMTSVSGLIPGSIENALLLERSANLNSLCSAVRMALRARRCQHETHETRERVNRQASDLEKRVTERTRNLQASVQSLEGVLYHVAHDLRAPLRSMHGFTTILLDEHAAGLGEEGIDLAQRISVAATRMDKLIQDLLAYGRLAHAPLSPAALDLGRHVQGVLEHLTQQIHSRKANVRIEKPLPKVYADPKVLDLLLTHLINNALTFVEPGVVPEIKISAGPVESGLIRLFVQDNGMGIAPEHHERIFRVFERLHGNNVCTGTGMGLAVVRKGVERMGGAAGVESKPGAGSRFWLDLPAAT